MDVGIYPNPATNNEIFVATTTELKTIVLYTINGQMIQKIDNPLKVEKGIYKLSNLPKGFYLVKLSSEEATITRKVLVN